MGFLDKAKAAANDLAAKADTALSSSGMGGPGTSSGGDADRYFRDLGILAYLEANGRPASAEDRARVMAGLQEMESRGAIRSFALQTSPPPAPGAAGSAPPPPGGAGAAPPPPPPGPAASAPPPPPGAGPQASPPPSSADGTPEWTPAHEGSGTDADESREPQGPMPPQAAPPPPSWMRTDGGDRT